MGVNPYEADPKRVPKKDPYLNRSPHYGRYAPQTDDFDTEYRDWHSPESDKQQQSYWTKVLREHCTSENSLNVVGSRAAFAVGKVIIRVDNDSAEGAAAERYSKLNANELISSREAQRALKDLNVAVPVIFFSGTIDGKNVVAETRIPGVSLEVAWNYLSPADKKSFRKQCQQILQRLSSADDHPPDTPSYTSEGLNAVTQPDIPDVEHDILFAPKEGNEVLCLTHNDMVRSNIIVDGGRVVAITGWRQSGYFGHDRAQKIHRLLRIPERSHIFSSGERSTQDQAWADLYDSLISNAGSVQDTGFTDREARVKAETPAASIEKVPAAQSVAHTPQFESTDEHPTPKKISDLKRGSTSRASSIDRSSPSAPLNPSKLGPNARKSSSVSTKKASIATKIPPSKKRKIDSLDSESIDDRRSNSPASSVKGLSVKKRASTSVTGSPAPEAKKGRPKKKKPALAKRAGVAASSADGQEQAEDQDDDSDVENPNEIFCICRKPDNHTWMIGCDGGCDDWFHGRCINIKQEDEDLIDRYICPNCKEAGKGQTTWKPMCRLKGCRKPARVSRQKISKYCSDDHGREFMRQMTNQLRLRPASSAPTPVVLDRVRGKSMNRDSRSVDGDGDSAMDTNDEDEDHDRGSRLMPEDLGSRGGILTISDLKAVIMGVSSSAQFRRLGDRLITPPPSTSPPARREEKKAKKEEEEEEEEEEQNEAVETKKAKKDKGKGKQVVQENKEEEKLEQEENEDELFDQKKIGLDIDPPGVHYSAAEEARLQKLRDQRDQCRRQRQMIGLRNQFLELVRARAKAVLDRLKAKEPKGGWKDICGWDARMSWNEEELDDWSQQTEAGRKAFEENKLEPEPIENLASNGMATSDEEDDDDDKKSGDAEFTEFSRGVCIKKRCDRHKQWVKIVQQDIQFEQAMLKSEFEECQKEATAIVEGAILRIHAA